MNNDNFYSIDRLVEFGLGIAVAQQMVRSMNHAMQNTWVPGTHNTMTPATPTTAYFAVIDGKQAGPFSEQEIMRLLAEGKINKSTLMWRPGLAQWESAETIPDVLRLVALVPPPLPPGA